MAADFDVARLVGCTGEQIRDGQQGHPGEKEEPAVEGGQPQPGSTAVFAEP